MLPQCHLVSDHFPGPYPYGGWRREDGKILSSGSCQVRRRLRVPGCYGASNKEVGVWGERRGKGIFRSENAQKMEGNSRVSWLQRQRKEAGSYIM